MVADGVQFPGGHAPLDLGDQGGPAQVLQGQTGRRQGQKRRNPVGHAGKDQVLLRQVPGEFQDFLAPADAILVRRRMSPQGNPDFLQDDGMAFLVDHVAARETVPQHLLDGPGHILDALARPHHKNLPDAGEIVDLVPGAGRTFRLEFLVPDDQLPVFNADEPVGRCGKDRRPAILLPESAPWLPGPSGCPWKEESPCSGFSYSWK